MKRRKPRDVKMEIPTTKVRNFNPHNRARVIPNKHKIYDRKKAQSKAEPSDFSAVVQQ